MSRFDTTGTIFDTGRLARSYVAPPVPLDQQQTGPLAAAYALNQKRLNGSVTNPMAVNGAAAGSPFNAAITAARPVTPDSMAEAQKFLADTQAAFGNNGLPTTPQAQANLQAMQSYQSPPQTTGQDVAEEVEEPVSKARDVQVIRGTQTSNVHFDEQGNPTETAGGRPHFTDPDVFQEIGESDQAYNQRKAAETSMAYKRQATGAKNPDVFQGVGETSDFFNKRKLQVQGLAVQKAEGEQHARSQTQAPSSDLNAVLSKLTPDQQQQLQTYKKAGATDQQVIARAITLGNRKPAAGAKPPTFSAGTQQDRYIVGQAQKRIRELDKKITPKSSWEDPGKLTPQEQAEYDGLKKTVGEKTKAIAAFDGNAAGSAGGATTIDTPEEFAALPSGSAYIDKQTGKRGRKP